MASSPHRRAVLIGLVRAFVLTSAVAWGAGAFAETPIDSTELVVETSSGKHAFRIELAVNDRDRARGLMFRKELADDRGMLFDFGVDRPVAMWMKNTYIPLDMLFIRSDGTIADIARNTVPLSEAVIEAREPVRYVLEVAAGTAARISAAPGNRVTHPAIRR